jgi:hypothetical protein
LSEFGVSRQCCQCGIFESQIVLEAVEIRVQLDVGLVGFHPIDLPFPSHLPFRGFAVHVAHHSYAPHRSSKSFHRPKVHQHFSLSLYIFSPYKKKSWISFVLQILLDY